MTVEPLLAQLQRGAEDEAARRLAVARDEAGHLLHEATQRIAHHRDAVIAERQRLLDRQAEARRAEAEREHAQAIAEARARLVDRVLAEAARRAPQALAHPRLEAALAADLSASLACLPDGAATVIAAPSLASRLASLVGTTFASRSDPARTACVREEADAPLGVRVESDDGRVRVDATWVRRLETDRDALAISLVRAVEHGGPP